MVQKDSTSRKASAPRFREHDSWRAQNATGKSRKDGWGGKSKDLRKERRRSRRRPNYLIIPRAGGENLGRLQGSARYGPPAGLTDFLGYILAHYVFHIRGGTLAPAQHNHASGFQTRTLDWLSNVTGDGFRRRTKIAVPAPKEQPSL